MAHQHSVTGHCLCGAVRFSGKAKARSVAACHCDMCRRWSAGPFLEITCDEVRFEGKETIGRIRSSVWAERGFCKKCVSNLFYHIVGTEEYQMSAGMLDDPSGLDFTLQVFIDSKPAFYEFANETATMTGAEIAAAYTPPPE